MPFWDVFWTTPTEVLGVLPVIVIFGLWDWEYSQYCYTTFVGVLLPMSVFSSLGVLTQILYHFCGSTSTSISGSTPKLLPLT